MLIPERYNSSTNVTEDHFESNVNLKLVCELAAKLGALLRTLGKIPVSHFNN